MARPSLFAPGTSLSGAGFDGSSLVDARRRVGGIDVLDGGPRVRCSRSGPSVVAITELLGPTHFVDGPSVDEGLYSRDWAAPITAPVAAYRRVNLWDQCRALFCHRRGTDHVDGDEDVTLLCDKHMELHRTCDECSEICC